MLQVLPGRRSGRRRRGWGRGRAGSRSSRSPAPTDFRAASRHAGVRAAPGGAAANLSVVARRHAWLSAIQCERGQRLRGLCNLVRVIPIRMIPSSGHAVRSARCPAKNQGGVCGGAHHVEGLKRVEAHAAVARRRRRLLGKALEAGGPGPAVAAFCAGGAQAAHGVEGRTASVHRAVLGRREATCAAAGEEGELRSVDSAANNVYQNVPRFDSSDSDGSIDRLSSLDR